MLKDLTRRYPDIFTDMPGETDVIQHKLKLTDDTPICCKLYGLLYAMREELRKEEESMLDMGVVRPSTSPYASVFCELLSNLAFSISYKVILLITRKQI